MDAGPSPHLREEIDACGSKPHAIPLSFRRGAGVLEVLSIKKGFVEGHRVLSVAANELAGSMSRRRLVDELRTKNIELETQTQKTSRPATR